MQRRLPPLNSLKAFEAAARLGSFNQAAAELRVTHGAISRHVQLLEQWLGTPMFVRLNRKIVLTDAGRAYQAEIAAAFDRIAVATAHHVQRDRVRLLRVNATPTMTLRWLIPRLSSFQIDNPTIEVRLTTSNVPIASLDGAFDIVIRRGPEHIAGFVTDWSMPDHRIPVCSPALLKRIPLRRVKDLERHTLLHSATRPTVWSDWLRAAGVPDLKPRHSLILEHSYQTHQGALDGLGIAAASWPLAMDDVAAGRLVLPFAGPKLEAEIYRAYVPVANAGDAVIAQFRSWLERISASAQIRD